MEIEFLRASVMSKMKILLMEVQSVARTSICQDSGIDNILSRQPLNVTDTGALHMAEETETYGRAFEDFVNKEYFRNVPIILQPCLLVSSSGP